MEAVVALSVLAFAGLEPSLRGNVVISFAALSLLTITSIFCRRWMSSPLRNAAILVIIIYALRSVPIIGLWPMVGALSLAVTAGVAWYRQTLDGWRVWLRAGRIDALAWGCFALVVILTVSGLFLWMFECGGRLPEVYVSAARRLPTWAAATGGLLFLILNGVVEDAIFFGILLTAVSGPLRPTTSIVAVSVAFGFAHFAGVPGGPIGIVMAGTWGVVLAALRVRTGGMLATYLAHVVADTTIIAVLLPQALT